jgi:hypothetical protein
VITSGISFIGSVGGAIALLWVVATVVRRHRPDAYGPLLAWAVASLVATGANFVVYPLAGLMLRRESSAEYLAVLDVVRVFFAIVHVGLVVLLVRGLVVIAQPPKAVVVQSDAPYR